MQAKTRELKNSLNTEFGQIHSLCLFVLNASKKPSLIKATLATLHAFLSWIPLGYIFESNLVEVLLTLFPQAPFRNPSLQCLTEVPIRWLKPLHVSPGCHICPAACCAHGCWQ
jgi:exportin-1